MASGGDTVATEATEATEATVTADATVTAEGTGVTIATNLSCHICHKTSGYSVYSCWNVLV